MRARRHNQTTRAPTGLVPAVVSPAALLLAALVRRDARPLAAGIVAAGIAAAVATFQIAVFTSFLAAGAAAPRRLDADAWVSAAGIACFDFPLPIAEDYEGPIRAALPGVVVRRVVFGFAPWVSASGRRGNVAVIGVDAPLGHPRGFLVDASDAARLDLAAPGEQASIGPVSATWLGATGGLATFLGAPYAIAGLDAARAMLRMPRGQVAYLALDFPDGVPADLPGRLAAIAARYPELSARTADQFLADSASYWQAKTGAGAAILLAAMLAGLLMAILLVNAVGRFLQRRSSDFVSMNGHGASATQLAAMLVGVAGVMTLAALALAGMLVPALRAVVAPLLPWVVLKPADAACALAIGAVAFGISSLAAHRALKRFPPDAMFRT